jgi:hypothetical protein
LGAQLGYPVSIHGLSRPADPRASGPRCRHAGATWRLYSAQALVNGRTREK